MNAVRDVVTPCSFTGVSASLPLPIANGTALVRITTARCIGQIVLALVSCNPMARGQVAHSGNMRPASMRM